MYHLTLEMIGFHDYINTKDFHKIQPRGMPSPGEKCESGINSKFLERWTQLLQFKLNSKWNLNTAYLSRFVLAIWCHLLTNESKSHHSRQGGHQPGLQPPPHLVQVSPTTTRFPPWLFLPTAVLSPKLPTASHRFLNSQVLILSLSLK